MGVLIQDDLGRSDFVDDLVGTTFTPFVDDAGNFTDTITEAAIPTTFPLMLLMQLRLHTVLFWGTILLMQTIP